MNHDDLEKEIIIIKDKVEKHSSEIHNLHIKIENLSNRISVAYGNLFKAFSKHVKKDEPMRADYIEAKTFVTTFWKIVVFLGSAGTILLTLYAVFKIFK